jgi:hypothetical protein
LTPEAARGADMSKEKIESIYKHSLEGLTEIGKVIMMNKLVELRD